MDNNAYLLVDETSGQGLLIDAANEAERILDMVADTRLEAIFTTHRHFDHVQALPQVAEATGAPSLAHADDVEEIPKVDRAVGGGEEIMFGRARARLVHTPGHTPGSTCVLLEGDGGDGAPRRYLFSGDTLFPGGPGRTTSVDEFERIMDSLEQRLFALPDDTQVCPGHGDDTTLGHERPTVPEWRARGW
ncbi:MBL fold metallo-hydrolase [Egibacter rhizosphaerae]|uniref:MBL fold metallo-hydrolase n=2 Tax=Egibacter rhizosphaerae TaxID=1670831 RepID=A0A411YLU2_9ACTN|nr:MBL fold metallo-hydrolase [Egibacter rhizosphaerae]